LSVPRISLLSSVAKNSPEKIRFFSAQADERIAEAALEEIAVGLVFQQPQLGRARPPRLLLALAKKLRPSLLSTWR